MKLRRRHRLRRKEVAKLTLELSETFGCPVFDSSEHVDVAEAKDYDVIIVSGVPLGIIIDGKPALTVKGLVKFGPTKRFVEVDMGAIPFIMNGADIMAPGIVSTDEEIEAKDLVWIRDERNKRPLALGAALQSGQEMTSSKKGKAVRTIHYVGDDLWDLEP